MLHDEEYKINLTMN